jgi:hypothetical protein
MKIEVIYTKNEYDSVSHMQIIIDGKAQFNLGEGEPEDMSFNRDLNDCFGIPSMLRAAYEAGKNGEEFNLDERDESDAC